MVPEAVTELNPDGILALYAFFPLGVLDTEVDYEESGNSKVKALVSFKVACVPSNLLIILLST